VRAMQFDINPEWPSLITYSHHHSLDPTRVVYLVPDDRDFFGVYRRLRPGDGALQLASRRTRS